MGQSFKKENYLSTKDAKKSKEKPYPRMTRMYANEGLVLIRAYSRHSRIVGFLFAFLRVLRG